MNNKRRMLFVNLSILVMVVVLSMGGDILSGIAVCSVLFVFINFLDKIGEQIPILDIMLLLCGFQWILSPYVTYINEYNNSERYAMLVSESTYMLMTGSMYISLIIGSYTISNKIVIRVEKLQEFWKEKKNIAFFFIIAGIIANIIKPFLPSSLLFVNFLLENTLYIGAIMLLYTQYRFRLYVFFLIFGVFFLRSIAAGMFYEFISWGIFASMFYFSLYPISNKKIILLLFTAVFLMNTIQTIKPVYRAITWEGKSSNKIELFVDLFVEQLFYRDSYAMDTGTAENVNNRYNQGWVFARIYNHIPENRDYFMGSTLIEELSSSILPRFIYPDKLLANGRMNFERFTGLQLNSKTAMAVSTLGEAYANFGVIGGSFFLFLWGVFLSWSIRKCECISQTNMLFVFFTPLIYWYCVRAVSDFTSLFNSLTKIPIFVFIVLYVVKRYFLNREYY